MTAKAAKTARKRLSQGQRKHIRRLKEEARKTGIPDSRLRRKARPAPQAAQETQAAQ